ncbi:MAG: hypothetical protein KDD41_08695 [Flavobacteriales bacterium]|nr:hypothetical protein [Flavobacteriales bacterium]
MKYFDIHSHISLKQNVVSEDDLNACWTSSNGFRGKKRKRKRNNRSKFKNYTQSDLAACYKGGTELIVNALHALEEPIINMGKLIPNLSSQIPYEDLRHLQHDCTTPFQRLVREYNYFNNTARKHLVDGEQAQFDIARDKKSLLENLDKGIDVNVVLSVEGAHCFHSNAPYGSDELHHDILNNFRTANEWDHPLFYLTLTHFAYNYVVAHSWSLPIPGLAKKALFKKFKPYRNPAGFTGITETGHQLIEEAIGKTGSKNRRTLIDIKHLHIDARQEYYNIAKNNNIPVIASHMGVSGIARYAEARKVVPNNNSAKVIGNGQFNPWPINLCDEEIDIILKSDGIIGLNLDQRILGAGNKKFKDQLIDFLKSEGIRRREVNYDDGYKDYERLWHTGLLVENILHIVRVASDKKKAWDQICMGADFDGNINPIDNCITIDEFSDLEESMVRYLKLIPDIDRNLCGYTPEEVCRKVMYENGKTFLLTHF